MIIKKNTAVFCLFVFSDENRLLIDRSEFGSKYTRDNAASVCITKCCFCLVINIAAEMICKEVHLWKRSRGNNKSNKFFLCQLGLHTVIQTVHIFHLDGVFQ